MEAGGALAFDGAVPLGPVGVEEDGVVGGLEEEGGVADPGEADFAGGGRSGVGVVGFAVGGAEHLGDEAVAPEVPGAAEPAGLGEDSGVGVGGFSALGHDGVCWFLEFGWK